MYLPPKGTLNKAVLVLIMFCFVYNENVLKLVADLREHGHGNRYLSRQDIAVLAGCGCPSRDRKVVNSGKRLRVSLGIEEGNVCT